jgi:hypothetical protein
MLISKLVVFNSTPVDFNSSSRPKSENYVFANISMGKIKTKFRIPSQ